MPGTDADADDDAKSTTAEAAFGHTVDGTVYPAIGTSPEA
jgi:hypothetical protein